MAKTTAILGAGTIVGYGAITGGSLPTIYTKLANLEDITPPKSQRDDVEISNHDSASIRKEFMPGWMGATDPTAKWIYNKTDFATLQGFANSGVSYGWQIVYPDGANQPFRGYVKDCGVTAPLKDKMESDVTIKVDDSNVTFTAGS